MYNVQVEVTIPRQNTEIKKLCTREASGSQFGACHLVSQPSWLEQIGVCTGQEATTLIRLTSCVHKDNYGNPTSTLQENSQLVSPYPGGSQDATVDIVARRTVGGYSREDIPIRGTYHLGSEYLEFITHSIYLLGG